MKSSEKQRTDVTFAAAALICLSVALGTTKPADEAGGLRCVGFGAAMAAEPATSPAKTKDSSKGMKVASGTGPATTVNGKGGATKTGASPPAVSEQGKNGITASSVPKQLPQITEAQSQIDLVKMPDSLTICVAEGAPITIGEYKRQYHVKLEQIQSALSRDAVLLQELLAEAARRHLSLTEQEKTKFINTSHKAREVTGGVVDKVLKEQHITQAQFDQHVLELGLAMKAARDNLDRNLLSDMVDRELICAAARTNGFAPQAFNEYTEMKKLPQYKQFIKAGMMSEDQMKDETIKAALMELQVKKIAESAPATDAQVKDLYEKNKSKFKHGDRIRLSQIVIACPKEDSTGAESVRTQIKKKNPKMPDKQLDAETKVTEQQLNKKAQDLLARALKGEDFAQLANQNTDDLPMRAAKVGGDMGFQEKDKLVKSFSDKVSPLKPGQVYPELIPSPLGYHIFKVTDKQPAGTMPLSEVKDALKAPLAQKNADEAFTKWVMERRKTATVTVTPEFKQAALASGKGAAKSK